MADNVAITAGSGTTIAADDVGAGVLVQRVKATWGPDGTANDTDVASGKPMPVQLRVSDGTAATFGSGAIAAGTPRVTLATDSPGVTALGQAAMAASLPVAIASNQSAVPVSVTDGGSVTLGAQADAASATTTISAKLRGIATALGITALDLGSGTGGSRTLRFFADTAQWIGGAGAVTSATVRTTLASDDPLVVKANSYSASATFTPAASSHTGGSAGVIGDCVGAAAEIDFNATSGSRIMITSATFEIDNATAQATAWRLYLYNVTPPSAIADDGPLTFDSGDRASFLGFIDLGTAIDHGNTQWVEVNGINKQIKLAGDSVFAYLVNLTTLTTVANAHIVTLHAVAV